VDAQNPPGLLEQLRTTIEAAKRLLRAHITLAKAEAGEIVDEVKRLVGFVAVALGLLFLVGILVFVGGLLFLCEWLFGSIGWGVLLGSLFLVDVAVVLVLVAIGSGAARTSRDLGIAALIGLVVGLVLALDLAHQGWTTLGNNVAGTIDPGWRTLVVAVVAVGIVGALLGLIGGLRSGGGAAIGGLVGGFVLGAVVGAISAIAIGPQAGAALGVLVALIVWPALMGLGVARTGIDTEGLKNRFMPDETIDETKETIEWVRARLPLAPKS